MAAIRNVLVATDFSPASARALEVASEIAARCGAKLTVLHTIENQSHPPFGVPPEIRRSAAFRLGEIIRSIASHSIAVQGMLREGFAWHEITEGAKEAAADLVVVGTHGIGHGERLLIGSVTERVLRICPVPVLTVHAWRFSDRVQAGRELAQLLLRSKEQAPTIVALSREAAVIAAEVADAFGAKVHVLLTQALERDGQLFGAVCEDGTVHLNERERPGDADRDRAEAQRAHDQLVDESRRLGCAPWVEDGKGGTIVLVSEAIFASDPIDVAARSLRKHGPHRVIAVAPVGTAQAREALANVVDDVIVTQVVEQGMPLQRLFRDLTAPDDSAIRDRLTMTREWAHAVKSTSCAEAKL